jgi:high-affinity iron transporter
MLINTVILFLRDALPIFVLIVYLYEHLPANKLWLLKSVIAGALLSFLYINQINIISQWFDGKGIELFLWVSQSIVYLLTLILAYELSRNHSTNRHLLHWVAGLMISLTMVSKGSNFVLYLDGYLNQSNVLQSILIGTFLGLGICLSLATLLYLAAQWLKQRWGPWATWLLVHIYATGQFANALPLLVQVDLIDTSDTAWSSQYLISNEYEFGHLFNVLFGYQASPSIDQIIVYLLALFTPLAVFYWLELNSTSHLGNKQ